MLMFNSNRKIQLRYLAIILLLVSFALVLIYIVGRKLPDWFLSYEKSLLPSPQTIDTFMADVPPTPTPSKTDEVNTEEQTTPTENNPEPTPEPAAVDTTVNLSESNQQNITSSISQAINLAVPFTVQAPNANWDELHEDFCEEASVAMTARFFAGSNFADAADADSEMMKIYQWELDNLGVWKDTTAQETKKILEARYQLKVEIVDFDQSVIKQALTEGKPVILPAAGRKLGNPYYKQPGPLYHMLVIKGYTKDDKAITNDPGTKRGADYLYTFDRLQEANGDYNNGDPANGSKIVLVVSKS